MKLIIIFQSVLLCGVIAGCSAVSPQTTKTESPEIPKPVAASGVPQGFYAVQPADTGAKIAEIHGLSLSDLKQMNPGIEWSRLRVGQIVRIESPK